MTLSGSRFGDVPYENEDVVTFEGGLIGFPSLHNFVMVVPKPESPFRWLQSVDDPSVAFLLAEPGRFVEGYDPVVGDSDVASLDLGDSDPVLIFVTASIPVGKPEAMTLNLAAPILINPANRKALQAILDNEAYTVKHRAFAPSNCEEGSVVAA